MCPARPPVHRGRTSMKDAPERVEVHFAGTTCEPCPLRSRCPVKPGLGVRGAYVLNGGPGEGEHRACAGGPRPPSEWRKRYDIRAGIEGTNSELKRAHGLGRLRVRGGRRVRLAVYLKALSVQLQADGPCTPGGDGEHGSAGGRDGTCGRGRMRAPLHNFHRAALSHGRGTATLITLVLSAADRAVRPAAGIP